jgi:hypothetical protein
MSENKNGKYYTMEFKDIIKIATDAKRIKNLTNNEHIHDLVDKILDVIQENLNIEQNKINKNESNNRT